MFSDPRLFNFVIMALYALNVVRWLWAGNWADAAYWAGALWITVVISFFYPH